MNDQDYRTAARISCAAGGESCKCRTAATTTAAIAGAISACSSVSRYLRCAASTTGPGQEIAGLRS
jgi:hypothetical protein